MGYQRIPVDALAQGQALTGSSSNALMYVDGSGNMATLSTLSFSATPQYLGIGTASPTGKLHISGDVSAPAALGLAGVALCSDAATFTDTVSSGTVASAAVHSFGTPTLAASSATTYTNSATVYIAAAPAAGTNATLTNAYSLWIAGGNVKLGALNFVLDTTTGTKLGTSTSQKLGFFNATPVVQRSGAAQAAVATTATTQTTPYGFATQAQGDNLVALCNEIRATLVELGLMKGAA